MIPTRNKPHINLGKIAPISAQFLPKQTAQKSIEKDLKYKEKLEARKSAHFNVTKENEANIWHNLSQSLFAVNYAGFHTKQLRNKGALMSGDRLQLFADDLEAKFETFRKSLPPEKQDEYIQTRNIMEDFFFRVSCANEDELRRTIGFLESLQNKRKSE